MAAVEMRIQAYGNRLLIFELLELTTKLTSLITPWQKLYVTELCGYQNLCQYAEVRIRRTNTVLHPQIRRRSNERGVPTIDLTDGSPISYQKQVPWQRIPSLDRNYDSGFFAERQSRSQIAIANIESWRYIAQSVKRRSPLQNVWHGSVRRISQEFETGGSQSRRSYEFLEIAGTRLQCPISTTTRSAIPV